jgi:farnesyl-diphosphate farnesyltransferase
MRKSQHDAIITISEAKLITDSLVSNYKQVDAVLYMTFWSLKALMPISPQINPSAPELLKSVSRSFYLTLRVLPAGLREPIGLAYLLARAADTIADTSLIPAEHRLELLLGLRKHLSGTGNSADLTRLQTEVAPRQIDSSEGALLSNLAPQLACLDQFPHADRAAIREVVTTLTTGMEFDLRSFPNEQSGRIAALDSHADLDRYTYLVAGCVGEFWTRMTCAHRPELRGWNIDEMSHYGIRFGKALQMTNILRDCAKDLRIGRCYLPRTLLDPLGLTPQDLLLQQSARTARPLLVTLLRQTLDHFRAAEHYILAIPRSSVRLRLACLWPVLIGLETLLLLVRNQEWLSPSHSSKIGRYQIYRIIAVSLPVIGSNTIVSRWIQGLLADIEAQLNKH